MPTRVDGKPLDDTRDLAVTAGWGHAGKDGVTMPGKGKLIERDYSPEEVAGSAAVPAAKEEQSQQDAGATGDARAASLGDRACNFHLNDVAYWKNVPVRVWEYTIGGYQVIKKWLSYREEKLLGRAIDQRRGPLGRSRYGLNRCRRRSLASWPRVTPVFRARTDKALITSASIGIS